MNITEFIYDKLSANIILIDETLKSFPLILGKTVTSLTTLFYIIL